MVVSCGIQAQMMEVESWCLLLPRPYRVQGSRRVPFTLPRVICQIVSVVFAALLREGFVARAVRSTEYPYDVVILLVSGLSPGGLQLLVLCSYGYITRHASPLALGHNMLRYRP